jgi:hypothetical protein
MLIALCGQTGFSLLHRCVPKQHNQNVDIPAHQLIRRFMALFKRFILFASLSAMLSMPHFGCAPYMAATQPSAKNIDLFKVGTPRNALLAEFGAPAVTEVRNGRQHEVFRFIQGYSTAARTGRALLHGVADVATFFLWEVVGTPGEAIFSGDEMAYDVTYDKDDVVDQVTVLKMKN